MEVSVLFNKLFDAWGILGEKNNAAKQQLHRKISSMKMDPKADLDLLKTLEDLKEEFASCVVWSNIGYFKIRVLKELCEKIKPDDKPI